MKNIHTPSTPDRDLDSLLIAAAINSSGEVVDENGLTQTVAGLLAQGANPNEVTSYGSTPLMIAARNGHKKIVSDLVNSGRIDFSENSNALIFAAENGHAEIVSTLLNYPVDVNREIRNERTGSRRTALTVAARIGYKEIVSDLVNCGRIDFNKNINALIFAAKNGHAEIVSTLLDCGQFDANAVTIFGNTALTLAAENDHAETVLAFLSRDDVNWQMVQNQLNHPALQNLNEEVSVLLAVALPGGEPRNSIIARFNQRNPNNAIQQENNDIIGAGPGAYTNLINLRSEYLGYLIDSGVSENEAKNLANERLFDLLNNPEKRQEALARNNLVTELVTKSESLAVDYALYKREGIIPEDPADLEALKSLSQEELYKLTKKIIDNSKKAEGEKVKDKKAEAQGIPTLKVLSFVASLPNTSPATAISSSEPITQQIDDPQDQTSPATVISGIDSRPQQIVGPKGGCCTVS